MASPNVEAPGNAPSRRTERANQDKATTADARREPTGADAAWLKRGVIIDKKDVPLSNELLRETRLLKSDFKYPLVRVERTVRRDAASGEDTVEREEIMVGSHLLVKPQVGVSETAFATAVKRTGGTKVRTFTGSDYRIVEFAAPDVDALPAMLKALLALPGVIAHAEPDYIVHAKTIPNDTRFSEQWSLNNTGQNSGTADADIDAPEAWATTTGSSSVIVAVIDSGMDYTHADLSANLWSNSAETAGNGLDDDGDGYIDDVRGWNFLNSNNTPLDDQTHGTPCRRHHRRRGQQRCGRERRVLAGEAHAAEVSELRWIWSHFRCHAAINYAG